MTLEETPIIVDYFHGAKPEYLDALGVDPTRLPQRSDWLERYREDYGRSIERRRSMLVLWSAGDRPIGFSTADRIVFGEQANMHLHVLDAEHRGVGFGTRCVILTATLYFDRLQLERLVCEPNAFNVAPNRTLQKAGFRYQKTHRTVPGPLNYHQAVTRWTLER